MTEESANNNESLEDNTGEEVFPFEGFSVEEIEMIDTSEFNRTEDENKRWEEIKEYIKKSLITNDGSILGDLSKYSSTIDSNFKNIKKIEDSGQFLYFHVEAILDQAADLLDRAIRDRLEWDELSAKYTDILLELGEFVELDKIHQEEEKNGLYEIEWWSSRSDQIASQIQRQRMGWLKGFYGQLQKWLYSNEMFNKVTNAARKGGWLSGLVPYTWEGQRFAGYTSHIYGGVSKDAKDHAADASYDQSVHTHREKNAYMTASSIEAEASEYVAKERERSAKILTTWYNKKREYQRRRTIVARRFQDMKTRAATDPEGTLNYSKRLDGIQERFNHDLISAIHRIKEAQKGLSKIYGYDHPLPSFTSSNIFDECLIWTRKAVEHIVRFSRYDQAIVIPVSLKNIVDNFDSSMSNGHVQFTIPAKLLPNGRHIRLRGISAYIDSGPEHISWSITLSVPEQGQVTTLEGNQIILDQSILAPATIGRVRVEDSPREPDVTAVTAWMNASPFGTWNLKVNSSIPTSELSSIRDCVINLHLAYRSIV